MGRLWKLSLLVGILILIGAVIVAAAATDYIWGEGIDDQTEEENEESGISLMLCTPFIILIGSGFLILGIIGLKRRRRNREYAELLKVNRRMKVAVFARKIGTTPFEAEKILMQVLEDKQVKGYMDRRTGEFFTMEFLEQTPDVMFGWKCVSCGAKNDSVILPGEAGRCSFCNTMVGAVKKEQGGKVSGGIH